jgi:VWFA-related protein
MANFQKQLAEAKNRLVNVSQTEEIGALGVSDGSGVSDLTGLGMGGGSAQERSFYLRDRVLGTMNVLKFIGSHFADLPGRKNLVWVSGGFPLTFGYEHMSKFSEDFFTEMDATVRSLSDANVAVYPVDARGLVAEPAYDASKPNVATPIMGKGRGGSSKAPSAAAPKVGNHGADVHATMDELAHRTGGHAYYNTNDLTRAIREAADDSAYTYTLGFYPEDEKHNRDFHKIKVEVDQPHINLSYRSGYLDLAEVPSDDRTRSIQIHDALWSPLDATELSLAVNVAKPVNSGAVFTGGAAAQSSDAVIVAVTLQPRGVQLKPQGDRYTGRVDVLMVQFDSAGRPLDSPMETVALNMLDATYRKFLTDGLSVKETLNIMPQTKSIRVIVRDFGSGMIGSVSVPTKDLSGVI